MYETGALVAVIIALGQLSKQFIDAKYIPLLSIVLGVLGGVFYIPYETLAEGILTGIMVGLASCGLFDLTKVGSIKR